MEVVSPIMTSNNTPAPYVVSASGFFNNYYPYTVFDGDSLTNEARWVAGTSGVKTGFLMLDFGKPILVSHYELTGYSTSADNPRDWKLEGSMDGQSWTMLDQRASIQWIMNEVKLFEISSQVRVRYIRIDMVNGGGNYLTVREWKLFGITPNKALLSSNGKILSFTSGKVFKTLSSLTEETFLKHGMNLPVDLTAVMKYESSSQSTKSILGSGQIYEHSIDLSKIETKKIILGEV